MSPLLRRGVLWLFLLATGLGATPALAQESVEERLKALEQQVELLRAQLAGQDSALVARMMAQIDAITREIEELKLGQELVVEAGEGRYGLGPAASKVYRVKQGVSIGGYGEVLYENFSQTREDDQPSGKTDQIDFLRAVFYVGYKFNSRFVFNSEIEFEHASTGNAGSVAIEFAYLDYLINRNLALRGGLLLIPMGFLNELHEPPIFLGTERPETERLIIPTTWRELGFGAFGEPGRFAYRLYVVTGFDAIGGGTSKASGFSASGLRGGRQKGSKAVAENFATVGRFDYVGVLGLTIGASLYAGKSGQGNTVDPDDSSSQTIDATTIIADGHASYRAHGIYLRALFAYADVDDVELINQRKGLTGDESVGEEMAGGYLEAGYDVLFRVDTELALVPYVRYEQLNTQNTVPPGFSANPATDQQIITLGASFKPIANIAIKADYQIRTNEANTGVDQFNINLGYLF